jgi:UDP-2,3-diacylglucosamine pyrophosphatase LpxH
MASKSTKKGEVVKSYLSKHKTTPILTLAKLIYSEKPDYFKSVEDVRDMIRYYAGLRGKPNREIVADKNLLREPTYNYNPFDNIPKSYKEKASVLTLGKSSTRIAVLSDIHFPYHDEEALVAAIDYLKEYKPDTIILNGDILDFYGLSSFDKDPSKPKMREELEQGRWFISAMRQVFPNALIYYKIGNHEMRLERWLKLKAPEWLGNEEFEIPILLKFGENRVHLVEKFTTIKAGNLNIIHGHEYKGGGTVNPARNMYLKTKSSVICGHFHRKSEHLTKDIDGTVHGSWSTGCLCELDAEYMNTHTEWVHGFATVDVKSDGSFSVDNKLIIDGKVL